jgi:hypothetical protein
VYFLALATYYDGTLAHDGAVDAETVAALRRLKNSGRPDSLCGSRSGIGSTPGAMRAASAGRGGCTGRPEMQTHLIDP